MDNQRIITAAFVGGLVAGALNSIPFLNFINCFCCAGIMLGGATALVYYDKTFEAKEIISPAVAVTVGIASGLFSAFISLGIDYFIYLNFGNWEIEFLQNLIDNLDEIPAELDAMIYELENELEEGFIWAAALFRNLLLMPVFCLIGSLIMRLIINKNRQAQE
jgi:hypothetical protein